MARPRNHAKRIEKAMQGLAQAIRDLTQEVVQKARALPGNPTSTTRHAVSNQKAMRLRSAHKARRKVLQALSDGEYRSPGRERQAAAMRAYWAKRRAEKSENHV